MAKIYFRKYKARIENGEITVAEAIELVQTDVPERWRAAVVELLEAYELPTAGVRDNE